MKRWAVIVGIDFYPSSRNLRGAVQDAKEAKRYLDDIKEPVDIRVLTATTPSDPSARRPAEDPSLWPTQANVIAALRRIIDESSTGDLVYFHFAGHGASVPNGSPSASFAAQDSALVLFEDNKPGQSYFRGCHLASALNKMVTKGVLATVVLDCCFSGGVSRHDHLKSDIRSIGYSLEVDISSPILERDPFSQLTTLPRQAKLPSNWLVDPEGYIILAACQPHEIAQEVEVEGLGRRGALTYFLFRALASLGAQRLQTSTGSLQLQISTAFHASWPQQTPMRYGNQNRCFFENIEAAQTPALFPIYRSKDGLLGLRAGRAHGIFEGDEFAVRPFSVAGAKAELADLSVCTLRAAVVRPFDSELVLIHPDCVDQEIQTGWTARLVTSVSPRRIMVRLPENLNNKPQEGLGARLHNTPYYSIQVFDEAPCMFNVITNRDHAFEVVDSTARPIPGLPVVHIDSNDALSKVMTIIQHISAYKFFEGVENRLPDSRFLDTFSITPSHTPTRSGTFPVKEGEGWGFTLENHGERELYVAIFDFDPSWGITSPIPESDGDYIIVPGRKDGISGKREIEMYMSVPESIRRPDRDIYEDVIKVFVTSKPVSFPSVVLPELPQDSACLSIGSRADVVSDIMNTLGASTRNDECEYWETTNFTIRTEIDLVGH